jgi:glycosyltransferase involved in cell wall biosynthesis
MKRLLAISWEMPPMYGPRGAQVSLTVAELASRGWAPSVVCLDPRRGGAHWPEGSAAAALPGVELVRVPSIEESLPWRVAARIAPIVRRFPDDKRLWVGRAAAAARRELARHRFTGMVTFAQPWSDHLVGLNLRRTASLPWVAHFSDPWVDSPYLRGAAWQQRIWRDMERAVVEQADAVVFITAETADVVMRKYPADWRRKVAVVPHGFAAGAAGAATPGRRPGPMRLVYTGRFYSGVRTPSTLLRALASLHRRDGLTGTLDVTFMGPHMEEFRCEARSLAIDHLVRFEGRQNKDDAAHAAADADVLLVIDAPSETASVFLPSKLVDYLAFRKPILGLTPVSGASARLLHRLGCTVVAPDDESGIVDALAALLAVWRNNALHVSPAFDRVAVEFNIRRTTAALDEVLARAFGHTS